MELDNQLPKWWLGLSILAVYIIIGCVLLVKTKKDLGGYMSFKEGFTTYFISSLIGIAISVIYNILLFNVIDPEAAIRFLSFSHPLFLTY